MINVKRFLTTLMCGVFVSHAVGLSAFTASAATGDFRTFVYDDYEITYNVTNSWGNTEAVTVSIINTGDETIENWMLYFDPNGEISPNNIWDAQTALTTSGITYFTNAGYNSAILPNASVNFSYFVDNCEAMPDEFIMCQKRAENAEYSVRVVIDGAWGNNFNGTIILENTSDNPIKDWELTFDTNFTITEITGSWAGTMTALEPYSYILKGSYTNVIAPHTSVNLGFSGVKNGKPDIISSTLTEVVVDEDAIVSINWDDWESLPDSDNDMLPDVYEQMINSDYLNPDTDGDGLPDGYEYLFLKTSPLLQDTDGNGILDPDEDFDDDGLSNREEYLIETDPHDSDTDSDELSDGDEVKIYNTDPLNSDTDNDGLLDGDEGYNGIFYTRYSKYFNPLNPDTDSNGVLDGDEILTQTIEKETYVDDGTITAISVNINTNGNLERLLTIRNAKNTDPLAAGTTGIIGNPIDISLPSNTFFETEATVTIKINPDNLGKIAFGDLLILRHDKETDQLYELETYYDSVSYTLTATLPSLGNILIVDASEWQSTYRKSTIFNDSVYWILNDTQLTWAEAKEYCESYGGHLVTVSSQAEQDYLLGLTTQYGSNYTYWLGYRYVDSYEDINPYWESVNGEGMPYTNWAPGEPNALYNEAVAQMYNIVPSIAKSLGAVRGQWNDTLDEQEFLPEYSYINAGIICEFDTNVDTDGDGIPDRLETAGMVTKYGSVICTDPNNPDTDGDGISDGDEMDMECKSEVRIAYLNPGQEYLFDDPTDYEQLANGKIRGKITCVYFDYYSDPTKMDTDGDGFPDAEDNNRLIPDTIENMFKLDASNSPDCPIYMEINKNTVILNVHLELMGDYESTFLGLYEDTPKTEKTYADTIVEGIEERWTTEFFGNGTIDPVTNEYIVYDFIEGLKGQLITKVILKDSDEDTNENQKYVICDFSTNLNVSNVSSSYVYGSWSISKTRKMFVYAGDNRNNNTVVDGEMKHKGVVAHEFGHILGLEDAYLVGLNGKYLANNEEAAYNGNYGNPDPNLASSMMRLCGRVYSNEVEMLLYAFSENKWQYYNDKRALAHGSEISKAIKLTQQYTASV